jgi:hypothetical protein
MTSPLQLKMGVTPPHRNRYLFSDHYLENILPDDPRWEEARAEAEAFCDWLRERYADERDQLPDYLEDQLEEHWFKPILRELGHVFETRATVPGLNDYAKHPDYVFFADEAARHRAAGLQNKADYAAEALAVGEVKRWDTPLGKKRKGGEPSFEDQNPSFQIDYYVRITGVDWGILTNGRLWRLVHRDSSQRLNVTYEVDLVDLLHRDDPGLMRYFTLFFPQAAFRPDARAQVFLDDVLAGSNAYAVALGEDVEENVYRALEQLMQGFLDLSSNRLGAEDLQRVHENSLYLLYRLLFILYGESRGLLPTDQATYREHYSLEAIKRDIAAGNVPPASASTVVWGRVHNLFHIINGDLRDLNRELGVPRYDGGLFDPRQHPFLEEKAVGDRALVAAIDLLSRRRTGERREFVDYRTLTVRHLGSIYEGLLEYRPRIAEEAMVAVGDRWVPERERPLGSSETLKVSSVERRAPGEVYLVTDRGERKATGSYYTPQYIVEYIVEHTLGPLVEEAVEQVRASLGQGPKLRKAERRARGGELLVDEILDLKVLDPAMGSGHFLVEATEYLARALATDPYVETGQVAEEDLTYWKRRVVERCIYGVDKNPLAVELAKLSLWLATVAADRPLSFLDHHLRCGDSLIGARVEDLGEVPPVMLSKRALKERKARYDAGVRQANLFETRLIEKLPVVMGRILEITEVESKDYDAVRAKEAADRAVRELKAPFEAVADLWTSAYFGNKFVNGEYDAALMEIGRPGELMGLPAVQRAREMAQERHFFHWELAFPEVFYDEHGQRLGGRAGFDAVVGNPPYYLVQGTGLQEPLRHSYPEVFSGSNDISHFFLVRGSQLLRDQGRLSFIITRYWIEAHLTADLRQFLTNRVQPTEIVDFENLQVWPEVSVLTTICTFKKSLSTETSRIYVADERRFATASDFLHRGVLESQQAPLTVDTSRFGSSPWHLRGLQSAAIWEKLRSKSVVLEEISTNTQGIKTGNNPAFTVRPREVEEHGLESEVLVPVAQARNVGRYSIDADEFVVYTDGSFDIDETPAIKKYLSQFKTELSQRAECSDGLYPWWRLQRPRDRNLVLFGERLLVPLYATENRFFFSEDTIVGMTDVYIICPTDECYQGAFLSSILNSCLLNRYHAAFCKVKRAGYLEYSGNAISKLPIRSIDFATPAKEREALARDGIAEAAEWIETAETASAGSAPGMRSIPFSVFSGSTLGRWLDDRLSPEPRPGSERAGPQADVVHDLLAHLAERMIAMHKEKQERVEAFWLDLEGVTDRDTFADLRERGKWESSLWKAEPCRPFVDEESRSTRHLDESLGWSEDCFKAFVKMLAGKVSNLSEVVGVYRTHHRAFRKLVRRIAATDRLIDLIVYRLYGLTAEEVAVVEGQRS